MPTRSQPWLIVALACLFAATSCSDSPCPAGFQKRGGYCHCPEGEKLRDGECVAPDASVPLPVKDGSGGAEPNDASATGATDASTPSAPDANHEAGMDAAVVEGGQTPEAGATQPTDADVREASTTEASVAPDAQVQDSATEDAKQPCGDGVCDLTTESSTTCALDCGPACFAETMRALWRGEGDAKDALGNADATLHGNAIFGAGYAGLGFRFESAPAYASVPQASQATRIGSGDFTLELWAKLNSTPGPNFVFGRGCPNCDVATGYRLVLDNGNAMLMSLASSSGRVNCSGPISAGDLKWHHYAATLDRDGQVSLYFDGKALGPCDIRDINGDIEGAGDTFMGTFAPGDANMNGRLDDVAVYSSALSPQQIANIANAPAGKCVRP